MSEKARLKRKIYEYDFAIHELVLFLNSNPDNRRALELLCEYRKKRDELIAEYEDKFGDYIVTVDDVPTSCPWKWVQGPWPWEKGFMEG